MDASEVWRRVESLEKTSQSEGLALLRHLLEEARRNRADPEEALPEAAVVAISALGRVDQRGVEREVLLSELRSEGRWAPELVDLLRRLLDRTAPDRLEDSSEALRTLDAVAPAVRSYESEARWSETRPPDPVPKDPEKVRRERRLAALGCGALVVALVGLLAFKLVSTHRAQSSLEVDETVAGTTVESWSLEEEAGRLRTEASWASRAVTASSSHRDLTEREWENLMSWPEVAPGAAVIDSLPAWAPSEPDAGIEWIEVEWNLPVEARTVVVVEAAGPGAVVAIDDIVDLRENTLGAKRYERLWSGRVQPGEEDGRYLLFHLAEPRPIHGLRVVLDTSRVPGESSIDTVGLIAE